jgi:hypothetical protein
MRAHVLIQSAFLVITAAVLAFLPARYSSAATFIDLPVSDRDGFSDAGAAGPYTLRPDGLGALIFGSGFDTQTRLYRTGMEFDLLGTFPQVQQATLSFNFEVVQNPPAGFVIHGYAGDGSVSAADLLTNNAITPVLTTPASFPPAYTVDVTAYVQQLVSGNQRYAGFMISGFPGGSGAAIRSSEPVVLSPQLTITAVPEPAVGALLMLGVVGALGARGRARRRTL